VDLGRAIPTSESLGKHDIPSRLLEQLASLLQLAYSGRQSHSLTCIRPKTIAELVSIEHIATGSMTTAGNVDSALDLGKQIIPPDSPPQEQPITAATANLIRRKNGRYTLREDSRIRGVPPLTIGFLDIANSGDFAANVFNHVPVPIHAIVLMAIGGTLALCMSVFALIDVMRSLENIRLLREERHLLKTSDSDKSAELELNHRDLGTEIFDRAGVDIAMGFGAFLIAIGTYMAIGGANRKVFLASNLLSGYVGNALPALYGLCNVGWSVSVWIRAHRQISAVSLHLQNGVPKSLLLLRGRRVQEHAVLTAVVCLISGALSMVTPTHWWPYPILLVCGLAFLYSTWVYKSQIGYERSLLTDDGSLGKVFLTDEICFLEVVEEALKEDSDTWLALRLEDLPVPDLLRFVIRCDIFEDLCCQLSNESSNVKRRIDTLSPSNMVSEQLLLELDKPEQITEVIDAAKICLGRHGLEQVKIRKRYLLEALGSCLLHHKGDDKNG
jgi:hypothetical protein